MADDFDLMGDDDFFGDSDSGDDDFFGSSSSDSESGSDSEDDFFGESGGRKEVADIPEEDLQSNEEKNRALRRIAFISLGVAAGIIIVICIIGRVVAVGRNGAVSKPTQKIEQTVQSNVSTGNTGNTNIGAVQSKSEWKSLKYGTVGNLETTVDDAVFTVTKVESYAKVMGDGEAQVRTEATGSISGLSGVYVIDVPFNLTGVVTVGKKLSVSYDMGNKNDMLVVGNIKIIQ